MSQWFASVTQTAVKESFLITETMIIIVFSSQLVDEQRR